MQALMLAAGMGKRLDTQINKCMVQVANKSLFEHAVNAIKNAGISKLIVVTGYNADKLESFILQHSVGMQVVFVRNEDYHVTNNIWSLYLAHEYFSLDDTVLLESDLIFDEMCIRELMVLQHPNVAVVAKYESWMDGTTVILNKNSIQKFVSKQEFQHEDFDVSYKTVNIYKFSKEFIRGIYVPALYAHIEKNGKNHYYEMVLRELVQSENVHIYPSIIQDRWFEIDTAEDLIIARKLFY